MGHLEAAAAVAGLVSLIAGPLFAGAVPVNAQLRGYEPWVQLVPLFQENQTIG